MFSWISTGPSAIAGACVLAMVLQDGGDRAVGPGADQQCAAAGGIDPGGPEALDQTENADTGAEPLLRVRPRTPNPYLSTLRGALLRRQSRAQPKGEHGQRG